MIPAHVIMRIKEATDLPKLVASYTSLRKSGPQWLVKCPWHKDSNPSCRVYDKHYFCFVCTANGTAIDWVMRFESLGTGDAIKYLAERAGIPLDQKPITRIHRAYATEEAELCAWWWARMRETIMEAGRRELQDPEQDFIGSLYRIRSQIDGMSPRDKFLMFREMVTVAERKEWEAERKREREWLEAWMGLTKVA